MGIVLPETYLQEVKEGVQGRMEEALARVSAAGLTAERIVLTQYSIVLSLLAHTLCSLCRRDRSRQQCNHRRTLQPKREITSIPQHGHLK